MSQIHRRDGSRCPQAESCGQDYKPEAEPSVHKLLRSYLTVIGNSTSQFKTNDPSNNTKFSLFTSHICLIHCLILFYCTGYYSINCQETIKNITNWIAEILSLTSEDQQSELLEFTELYSLWRHKQRSAPSLVNPRLAEERPTIQSDVSLCMPLCPKIWTLIWSAVSPLL